MSIPPKQVLIVEDDAGLAELLGDELRTIGINCSTSPSAQACLDYLANTPTDLLLLDYSLPDMPAHQLVDTLKEAGHLPPFIVVTGHGDEQVAVRIMKQGARDYLIKDALLLQRLPEVVKRTLEEITTQKQLQETEQKLAHNEAELAAIYDSAPLMMCLVNQKCEVERMNRALLELSNRVAPEKTHKHLGHLINCAAAQEASEGCNSVAACANCPLWLTIEKTFQTGQTHQQVELTIVTNKDTRRVEMQLSASTALARIAGQPRVLVCLEDISSRKQLEAQFRQAQKMEAIGHLAGGVAHDFNNILAAMMLHLGLLRDTPDLSFETAEALKDLQAEARRATELTRQLLMFGRRQMMQKESLDLTQVVESMMKMLRRLMGENYSIKVISAPFPMPVEVDAGMVEQVVMNLCVNARDAMPNGGSLNIHIQQVDIDAAQASLEPEAREGRFIRLNVKDVGCGMDEVTLKRIFEPFFTTKDVGKGTGLGLSTVYGIIKQHQGWITVESKLGEGSTFHVYLPAAASPEKPLTTTESMPFNRGTETILVVEDDPALRKSVKLTLARCGYKVMEAKNGLEALRMWDQCNGLVDMLFTDMIMPEGINGWELAHQLQQLKPGLKTMITSGYSMNLTQPGKPKDGHRHFLSKPYVPAELAKAVRQCLDEK